MVGTQIWWTCVSSKSQLIIPPSLADPDMTDGALQARVADLPRNTILLLEDIDAAFTSRCSFHITVTFCFWYLHKLGIAQIILQLDFAHIASPIILIKTVKSGGSFPLVWLQFK